MLVRQPRPEAHVRMFTSEHVPLILNFGCDALSRVSQGAQVSSRITVPRSLTRKSAPSLFWSQLQHRSNKVCAAVPPRDTCGTAFARWRAASLLGGQPNSKGKEGDSRVPVRDHRHRPSNYELHCDDNSEDSTTVLRDTRSGHSFEPCRVAFGTSSPFYELLHVADDSSEDSSTCPGTPVRTPRTGRQHRRCASSVSVWETWCTEVPPACVPQAEKLHIMDGCQWHKGRRSGRQLAHHRCRQLSRGASSVQPVPSSRAVVATTSMLRALFHTTSVLVQLALFVFGSATSCQSTALPLEHQTRSGQGQHITACPYNTSTDDFPFLAKDLGRGIDVPDIHMIRKAARFSSSLTTTHSCHRYGDD